MGTTGANTELLDLEILIEEEWGLTASGLDEYLISFE